jgi:hypothetical protein
VTPKQKVWVDPAQLPEMNKELLTKAITLAALALKRMDFVIETLPEGVDLWVYEITESERQFVRRLQEEHPATDEMRERMSRVLDQYSEVTTVDGAAFAAVQAVIWAVGSITGDDAR